MGDEHGDGGENGRDNGDENGEEGGREREPGNLRSGYKGGIGRKTREGGRRQRVTGTHSRKTRRRIMLRTRAQGREARDRIREGGGEAKKLKEP